MEFTFINDMDSRYDAFEAVFTDLLTKTLTLLDINQEVILEASIVSKDTIKELNRQYRGIDRATDVLSFAFLDEVPGEIKIVDAPFIDLGAIVISSEIAEEQAKRFDHGITREMSFLFVHGLLHLCGYDHQTATEEQKMIALQDAIVGKRELS